MKVYISGKISGLDRVHVVEKFGEAEKYLSEKGFEVVNPTRNGLPWDAPWESHMAVDILELLSCDAIYLLPCWNDSRGATLEKRIAELKNKKVWDQNTDYSIEVIQMVVQKVTGVTMEEIRSGQRDGIFVFAKYIIVRLLKETGLPSSLIAKLTNRSEKNIQYSLRKYDADIRSSQEFKYLDQKVRELLK